MDIMRHNAKRAKDDARSLRKEQALELRIAGNSYRDIAKELGIDLRTAWHWVDELLEEHRQNTAELAVKALDLELKRLDIATELVIREIKSGNIAAVDRLTKITERRSKLLGLDAPDKAELDVSANLREYTASDISKAVADQFGKVGPKGGENDPSVEG